jgi:autotransporter-associated beta strand protein
VISESGGARNLTINGPAGGGTAWGGTAGILRLDAANTYTGGTVLASGTLLMNHVDALSSGALSVTGASTLSSLVDLTGLDALANALNLSAALTFTGSNGVTFSGTTTNIGAGGITNSLTAGNLLFAQVNLAETAAAAARTLTIAGASTGTTTITSLLNNDQNNTLTNNLSGAGAVLSIGTIALSESAGTGRTLTLGGTGNTTVTGLIEDVAGGGGVAGTLQKAGTGTLTLQATNTFTGPVNVNGGNLDFSTVTNIGGGPSNLGAGSQINLGGGTLRFIGSSNQTTDRPINASVNSTLNTSGTGGAEISYTGPINMAALQLTLTGASVANVGNLSGGITQTGTAADLLVNSGTWNLTGTNTFSDDVIVTGTNSILNLNATGTLAYTAGTSNGLYSRDGAVININAANVSGVANSGSLDFILIADTPTGAAATVNMASGSSIETPRLDVGSTINPGRTGNVTGTGLITVTSTATDYLSGIRLFDGSITADLAGVSSMLKQGTADFTLSGNNSGLTGTVAATRIDAGNLILDYTTQNNNKISAVAALDMRGSRLTLNGNNSAATAQSVASFTLANGGANTIALNPGTGQTLVLNLGAITRAATAGTVRVLLPTGTQDATNGVTTTTAVNANGTLGGFLTVTDATGTYFATKSGNNITAVTPTVASDASTWTNGQNITDTGTAFSGSTGLRSINSLSFNHATGGSITVANTATLDLFSGGALVTSNVTGGAPTITGGRLTSSIADVIVTHDGSSLMTINSQIGLNNGVTKTGNGTLLINGAINNYTGATQIQAGTLQVSGGNAIGNASSVVLSDDRASTLELLADETIGNLSGGNAGASQVFGTVALGSNTLFINSTANGTYAGVFTGSGSIVRNGASGLGNLFFTGNSGAGFTGALVTNGGMMYVEGVATMDASSLTINKGGSFLISNNGSTRSGTRFLDTMPIILNSADGAWGSETRPSGLSIRTDQNATTNETVGLLSLASGASYFRGDASGTTGVAGLIVSEILRSNGATINARGRALGATTGDRNFVRIVSASANETSFVGTLVGGGGAAGAKNISIIPWGIGEATAATLADANMGNSLLTYTVTAGSGAGLRPLNLTTEYNTFGTKAADTDNIRESLAADLTGLAGQTINALVVNNSNTAAGTVNVTGTGAAQTLAVTSGTMLFTATAAVTGTPAMGITLGGFDNGITVGGTNEYVIFVQNPTSAAAGGTVTATVSSPLTSTADITKSGRGVLVLSGTNTAGGATKKTTINEGTLEIADLDNIGGDTGGLVFAGGTLRLGTGLTDDISTRTISFLNGGGTIDTNNVNLSLANSVGSGVGGLTKVGLGTLTLGAASTYTGRTTVSGGTLAVTANNATGGGGALAIGAGAILDLGANSIIHSTVATTGASPIITGSGTITSSGGFNFTHTGDTAVDAVLAGVGGLFKNQTNVLTLNGTSTFTGGTEIQNGTVAVSVLANAGVASSLGAPAAGTDASVIRMGLTTVATSLNYVGTTNSSTDRLIAMQGTTGGVTLNGNGIGAVDYVGGAAGYSTGAKTLTLSGTSDIAVVNRINGITDGIGTVTLAKSGTNLWEVYGTNTYTGPTQINNGTLQIGSSNTLPVATAVRLGTGTTSGTLDLNGFDQTIGSLAVQTNSNAVTNNIIVDTGKTLTINGAVTLGVNANESDTNLNASGGGAILVNSGNANFQIGAATGDNENRVDVDFTGLASFTANLGTGTFRLGDPNTGTGNSTSTFKLAQNNQITAALIRIGDGTGGTNTHTLTLGSGSNALNADTINIGSAGTTIRSGGAVVFDALDTTGAVTIRASDGTSRAAINVINTTGTTAGDMSSNLDFTGHTADIFASTVAMAVRSASTGAATAMLTFDQGTLDVTTLTMASRTGSGTGNATATVNLGDSAAPGSPTTTIGALNMAVNTSAGGTVIADFNVAGGVVNIGDGLNTGTAINMANAGASRTVTSNISLNGGSVNVTGNIIRTGGAGTENATVTLNGSTLAMGGNSIGTLGQNITFAAQSGILSGLAQLNGGGLLDKTTAGILSLGNGNAYTGGTTVTAGTLLATNTTGSATGSGAVSTLAGSVLGGTGIIAPGSGGAVTVDGTLQVGGSSPVSGQTLTIATNAAALTINNLLTFDLFSGEGSGVLNGLVDADRLLLTGNSNGATVVLGASSVFEITTTVVGGWTPNSSWQLIDWAGLVPTGTFSNLTSTVGNFANMPDLSTLGLAWDFSSIYSTGVVSIAVIPEPSRAMLLLLGLLGLFFRRRRD